MELKKIVGLYLVLISNIFSAVGISYFLTQLSGVLETLFGVFIAIGVCFGIVMNILLYYEYHKSAKR